MKRITKITIGIVGVAAAIAGAAAFLLPSSGGGFDQLEKWVAVLDGDDSPRDHLFDFVAPRSGFRVDGEAVKFVNVPYAARDTLLVPGSDATVRRLIGFDLPNEATATMVLGNWPRSLVMFAIKAKPAALRSFAQAYDERNFATETIDGVTVRHIREDETFDPARRSSPADPFDNEVGQPQRVTYVEGTLVGAANWDGIRQGLAGLAPGAPCQACLPWREVIAALRSETGRGAHLYMADGRRAEGFKVETLLSEAGLSIPLAPLPSFDTVLFAATEKGGTYAAHLAVRFPDASDAEAGLAEIRSA